MAERLKAPVLKTGEGRPSQSSNLCASANLFGFQIHWHPKKTIHILILKGLSGFFSSLTPLFSPRTSSEVPIRPEHKGRPKKDYTYSAFISQFSFNPQHNYVKNVVGVLSHG